ncbi:calcineurin-like phosphoesterase family protein [Chitinophaga polysaccharea]|uniref:Calcineurin-like phosphoesterase family protein n=1 Tax=Chitinophaga polysaccharea TaxID=1293035 RepID=A0A561PNU9_9BACT|nr:metallophosphoesterase [Chitinophaga polysaccharea]TWF39780.1 calcineurin-like phosphoesterase family protein [Chitinophaga polysaccharea]
MNRRDILKHSGLLAAGTLLGPAAVKAAGNSKRSPVLTVAHITDVHIREDLDAPARFKKCLEEIKKKKIDFFLNGGDSIFDASYDNVVRDRVTQLWGIWDDCISSLKSYEVHSCLGNHDMWWKAPSTDDSMYGKDYVVKRLKIPHRYYSFTRKGWHFIILDGNNDKTSLDEEQYQWLEKDLQALPAGTPTLVMSHYPILGVTPMLVGGGHGDHQRLKSLFFQHRDKVKVCLSGHNHLADNAVYNGIRYCCNGAMSGFWWGKGDKESAGEGYYLETPPGYAILRLYADGSVENEYIPHHW